MVSFCKMFQIYMILYNGLTFLFLGLYKKPAASLPDKKNVESLLLRLSGLSLTTDSIQKHQVYILPTTVTNSLYKKTIINPLKPCEYFLPDISIVQEKLTPGLDINFPKIDPDILQTVIDRGSPPLVKHCMPYLVRVRYKKMKKHKLKKLRKRMLPLNRKLTEAKKRKKEKATRATEQMYHDTARLYKPEEYVDDQLRMARKGGYRVDIFQTRNETRNQ